MHVLLFTVSSKFSVPVFRFMRPALTVLLRRFLCQFVGRRVTVWVIPPAPRDNLDASVTDDYNSTALAFSDISKAAGKPAKCSRDQYKAADLVTIDLIVSAEQRRSERNVRGEAAAVSDWLQK